MPADHPLRRIPAFVLAAPVSMHGTLTVSYSHIGRIWLCIALERLIRAVPLQVLYSIPSERQLVEQLRYNMLFLWLRCLSLDDAKWDATTFTKNRARFVDSDVTARLLNAAVNLVRQRQLLPKQHFCVDNTLTDAWASMDNFRWEDHGNGPLNGLTDFKGKARRADMHDYKVYSGISSYHKVAVQFSRLCCIGHVLDDRPAPVVDAKTTRASGTAEVDAALAILDRRPGKCQLTRRRQSYDQRRFIQSACQASVTRYVAQKLEGDDRVSTSSLCGTPDTRNRSMPQVLAPGSRHRLGGVKPTVRCTRSWYAGSIELPPQVRLVFVNYNLKWIAAFLLGNESHPLPQDSVIRNLNGSNADIDQKMANDQVAPLDHAALSENLVSISAAP